MVKNRKKVEKTMSSKVQVSIDEIINKVSKWNPNGNIDLDQLEEILEDFHNTLIKNKVFNGKPFYLEEIAEKVEKIEHKFVCPICKNPNMDIVKNDKEENEYFAYCTCKCNWSDLNNSFLIIVKGDEITYHDTNE